MGDVVEMYPPHPPQLKHCFACDAYIKAQWDLAVRSGYVHPDEAIDDHEPRIDSPFWDDVEEHE